MNPGPETNRVLLTHMGECIERIRELRTGRSQRCVASRLVTLPVKILEIVEGSRSLLTSCECIRSVSEYKRRHVLSLPMSRIGIPLTNSAFFALVASKPLSRQCLFIALLSIFRRGVL